MCDRGCPEENVYWKPKLVLYSGIVGYSEVYVDFAVYYSFAESKYWLLKCLSQADIPSGEPVFVELIRYFKIDWGQCDVVLRLSKILYVQAEAACLW